MEQITEQRRQNLGRPVLITLSGPEGCGKTTNREFIVSSLCNTGLEVKAFHTSSLAFSSYLIRCMEIVGLYRRAPRKYDIYKVSATSATVDSATVDKVCIDTDSFDARQQAFKKRQKSLRALLINYRRCLGYVLDALILRALLHKHRTPGVHAVVCDRYIYDALSRIVETNPRWVRLIRQIAPKPDIAFLLRGDPFELCQRRPGSTIAYHQNRLQQFDSLCQECPELIVVNPAKLEEIQTLVRLRVEQFFVEEQTAR